jgi:hypothetical protein
MSGAAHWHAIWSLHRAWHRLLRDRRDHLFAAGMSDSPSAARRLAARAAASASPASSCWRSQPG